VDIDGFRCDMAHLVPSDFWQQARKQCDALKDLYWLGECEVEEYNKVFDATYGWEWMHITERFVQHSADLDAVKKVSDKYRQLPAGANKLLFTSNHDENSWNGTEYEKYGYAAKAFAVFTCCWPGIPLIYSGQELPNTKRLSFFDKDFIDWENQDIILHNFYKTLLELRKANKACYPKAKFEYFDVEYKNQIIAFLLTQNGDQVIALFNFSGEGRLKFTISDERIGGKYQNVFSGIEHSFDTNISFEMQPWEYIVYQKK
jgi:glycosidase